MFRMLTVVTLLLCSTVMTAKADVVVTIGEGIVGGSVSATPISENGVVTLTVTPATGYTISRDDVKVVPMVDPAVSGSRSQVPVASPLTLSGDDPADLTQERQYTFTVPEGYSGAYVTATFHKQAGVTIEMGEAGLRTYSANVDLDFTGVTGLKAYVCNVYDREQSRMVMLRVTSVPAGTGVLLRGEAGSYKVPEAKSSTYLVNLLMPAVDKMTLAPVDGEKTNFVLSKPEGKEVAFYRVSESGTFGPNKAYLQLPTSAVGSNSRLSISFDEATAVYDVPSTVCNSDDVWYDLQGRKIVHGASSNGASKGVYIHNGKKVVR